MGQKLYGYDVNSSTDTRDVAVKPDGSYFALAVRDISESIVLSGKETWNSGQQRIYGGSSQSCRNVKMSVNEDCYIVKSGNTEGAPLYSGSTVYDYTIGDTSELYFYVPPASSGQSAHYTVFK